ncbi:glycerophosphodiester phosphodiesterase [Methylobacter sp.]|uniref:glycerophosphodiester phosphodiesterase n=1 Tax=Methylobacter sp. TaxID=2051955 RepID=UPI003DA2ACCA
MQLPIIVKRPFRIIAHRGASAYTPENTWPAFKLAMEMGVKDVELDVQLSSDGEVVICHDLSLERYGHSGHVEAMSWPELSQLDMGSWFSPYLFHGEKLLRLQDLLKKYSSEITYHIELKGKSGKLPDQVYRIIEEFNLSNRVIIISFSYEHLKQIRAIAPCLRLGWLVQQIDDEALSKARALELFQICPRADLLKETAVHLAHSVVPEIRTWGLNGRRKKVLALIQKTIDAGCDGATVNWPDWISY